VLEAHANLITSQAGATLSPNQVKALLQASPLHLNQTSTGNHVAPLLAD
jgi:hypothetical protein